MNATLRSYAGELTVGEDPMVIGVGDTIRVRPLNDTEKKPSFADAMRPPSGLR